MSRPAAAASASTRFRNRVSVYIFLLCTGIAPAGGSFAQNTGVPLEKAGQEKKKETQEKKETQKKETETIHTDRITISEDFPGKGSVEKSYQKVPLDKGQNRTARKISEVIETQRGMKVNRLGAPGTYSSLSIRGANPNQSGVYIDGTPFHDIFSSSANLENLPIEAFESVEIYRSYSPAHLQGSRIGGAIDLIPRRVKKGEHFWFLDSFANSLEGQGLGAGLYLPWTMQFAKAEQSKNRYDYHDDNGTFLLNTQDDRIRKRKNEDYALGGYTGIFSVQHKDHIFKGLLDFFNKERGIAGTISNPLSRVRLKEDRGLGRAVYQYALSKNILLESSGIIHAQGTKISDPKSELVLSPVESEYSSLAKQLGFQPSFSFWKEKLNLSLYTNLGETQVEKNKEGFAERKEQELGLSLSYMEKKFLNVLLQGKIQNVEDKAQGRLQAGSLFQPPALPKHRSLRSHVLYFGFSPLYFFTQDRKDVQEDMKEDPAKEETSKNHFSFEVYGTYSENERVPSIAETYGDGGLLLSNLDLKIEKSRMYSYGLSGDLKRGKKRFKFIADYFQTHYDNLIIFLFNSSQTIRALNAGSASIKGIEGELSFIWQPYILSIFRYTYLDTRDQSILPFYHGKRLPFRPQYSIEAYLESGTKRIRPFISVHWLSEVYRDRANSKDSYISQRTRVDSGVSYFLDKKKTSRISFLVKNIFDEYHSDVLGYPLPDRVYEIQFYMEFRSKSKNEKTERI